jgi:hypothetical protein
MKYFSAFIFTILIPLFSFAQFDPLHQIRPRKCPASSRPECQKTFEGGSCIAIDYDHGAETHFGYCARVGYPNEFGEIPCQCEWPR